MLIVGPLATATVIDKDIDNNDDDDNNNCRRGRGVTCPPPSGPSHPSGHRSSLSRPAGCRLSLSMLPIAADGGGTRAFGAWSYAWWRRKGSAIVLIRQVLIQPGVDKTMGGRGVA